MTDVAEWRPQSGPETARLRAAMMDRARDFFRARDILEVGTPSLSRAAVSDPHIESITASLSLDRHHHFYLHTSPEYFMKRLLCAGYPDIFQISKVFRDNEAGRFHQPEFTMIEWYRLKFDLDQIIDDTLDFIACILDDERLRSGAQHLGYREAFQQFAGCDPFTADVATLAGIVDADDALRHSVGSDLDAWLDLVQSDKVVGQFAQDQLTVLSHYPLSQAALARQCPADEKYADRFEVFLGQHELANGYVELTDADELARRFRHDQALRKTRGQMQRPLDNAFLEAIKNGLPQCAGVATGFDRLLMIHAGSDDIRNVQTFAFVEEASMTTEDPPDFDLLNAQLAALTDGESDALANCANFVALLFNALLDINWLGIYVLRGNELVLGPFQGNPACVRIPVGRGFCGGAAEQMKTFRIDNVHEFAGHIACDAASNSEIVVPLAANGVLLGVLDIDSPSYGRFSELDQQGIEKLCRSFENKLTGGGFI